MKCFAATRRLDNYLHTPLPKKLKTDTVKKIPNKLNQPGNKKQKCDGLDFKLAVLIS